MTNDLITVLANVALTLSFLVALIFGVVQVKAAARDRRERLTLETLRNFQTHEFAVLLHYINTHKIPKDQDEMQKLSAEEQSCLFNLHNKWNRLEF